MRIAKSLPQSEIETLHEIAIRSSEVAGSRHVRPYRSQTESAQVIFPEGKNRWRRDLRRTDFLVRPNFDVGWMVDDGECDFVEIRHLPKFFGDSEFVSTITWLDLSTINFQVLPWPVFGDHSSSNLQTKRSCPETVGHEDILFAIPSIQIGA